MITEKLFKDSLNAIVEFTEQAEKIYNCSGGCIDLNMSGTISRMEACLSNLLSYCVKDYEMEDIGTNIEYFLYELDRGKRYKPGDAKDEHGNNIDMSSVDAMWEYFKKENPDIEDKTNEEDYNKYKAMSDEELKEMFEKKGLHSTLSMEELHEIFKEMFN